MCTVGCGVKFGFVLGLSRSGGEGGEDGEVFVAWKDVQLHAQTRSAMIGAIVLFSLPTFKGVHSSRGAGEHVNVPPDAS